MIETLVEGKYGIDSIKSTVKAANTAYDLFEAVYLDDRKFGRDDWFDLASGGPKLAIDVIEAGNKAELLDEEIGDLSEAEKEELLALSGERIEKPAYQKILKGLLEITDGIAELKNPDNPVG